MADSLAIAFTISPASFDEMDRRFGAIADGFARRISSGAGAAGGSGGGGGGGAGGMGTRATGGASGAGGMGGAGAGAGMAAGGAAGAAMMVAAEAAKLNPFRLGAEGYGKTLQGASSGLYDAKNMLNERTTRGALNSIVEGTVGRIPIIGDQIMKRQAAANERIEAPQDATAAQVGAIYGQLAAAGYEASEDQINRTTDTLYRINERKYEGTRNAQRAANERMNAGGRNRYDGRMAEKILSELGSMVTSALGGLTRSGN